MKTNKFDAQVFLCRCHSLDKVFLFWYDKEFKILYVDVKLKHYLSFWKRLYHAAGYIFARKDAEYDCFIFADEDIQRLHTYLSSTTI